MAGRLGRSDPINRAFVWDARRFRDVTIYISEIAAIGTVFAPTATSIATPSVISAIGTVYGATLHSYHYQYPTSDISGTGWTTNTGSSSNLYAAIDEVTTDDADYVVVTL